MRHTCEPERLGAYPTGTSIFLAAAGVYGMVSYSVSQRTQEIGIRVALGARPVQVMGEILRAGMTPVSIGVATGIVVTLWGTGLLGDMLFGVTSRDPVIYVAVAIGITAVAFVATLLPARRAATVDPMRALHFQ